MMSPTCPRCHAPLNQGSLLCSRCGHSLPPAAPGVGWSAPATAPPAGYSGTPPHGQMASPGSAKTARTALLLSLSGLLCCVPGTWVGGAFGLRAMKQAKAEGVNAPFAAVVAILMAMVTTAASVVVVAVAIKAEKGRSSRSAALTKELSSTRMGATLDAATACKLTELYALEDGLGEGATPIMGISVKSVACGGAFESSGGRAVLRDVTVEQEGSRATVTSCLAYSGRWFVLDASLDADCAKLTLEGAPHVATSEEAYRKLEAQARESAKKAADLAAVSAFRGQLEALRRKLSSTDAAPAVCTIPSGKGAAKVQTVDYDRLAGNPPPAASEWAFLTSATVTTLLSGAGQGADHVQAMRTLQGSSGPYLVVYRGKKKVWPKVIVDKGVLSDDIKFSGGHFDGVLSVVHYPTGEVLCSAPIQFENSERVSFKRRGASAKERRAEDAVMDDFKENFETAATQALGKLTSSQLKLGYSILE
jgi:hypothetical protein